MIFFLVMKTHLSFSEARKDTKVRLCVVYWEQNVLHVHISMNLHHFTIK